MSDAQEVQGQPETAIVEPRFAQIKHLGDRDEIASVTNRLLSMIPGAQSMPRSVVYAVAQLAVAYRLDPFGGEIYIAQMGRKKVGDAWQENYVPMIGIKGLRTLARRASHYLVEPLRQMDAEEVKALRGSLYHEEDVGVEVRLHRLDVVRECRDLGVTYYPTIGRGFWRKLAQQRTQDGKKEWFPDNIPETWTRLSVAEKRAEKDALTKAFDLHLPPSVLVEENFDYDMQIERMVDDHDRSNSFVVRPERTIQEEDGDILYATS